MAEIMRSKLERFSWSSNPHLRRCNLCKTFILQVARLSGFRAIITCSVFFRRRHAVRRSCVFPASIRLPQSRTSRKHMPTSVARWTTFLKTRQLPSAARIWVKDGKMMNLPDAGPSKEGHGLHVGQRTIQGRVHQLGPSSQL